MTNDKEELINHLQANIKTLINLFEKEKEASNVLRMKNSELSESLKLKDVELEKLEAKFNNLKVARTIASKNEDVQQAKIKVNSLVREIDKCIALLNR
jgi:septation ring formation regulator EzrA